MTAIDYSELGAIIFGLPVALTGSPYCLFTALIGSLIGLVYYKYKKV